MTSLFLMKAALPLLGLLLFGSVRHAGNEMELQEHRAFEEDVLVAPEELDVQIEIIPAEPLPPVEEPEAEGAEGAVEEGRDE